jgi:hypothetical protein
VQKLSPSGDPGWSQTLANSQASGVAVDAEGNVYVAGSLFTTAGSDLYLRKYAP